jgi:hypothetical protein
MHTLSSTYLVMSDLTVKIICRNVSYTCAVAPPRPYQQPRALNWRYQVPGKTYNQPADLELEYHKPRAINWRWQPLIDRLDLLT